MTILHASLTSGCDGPGCKKEITLDTKESDLRGWLFSDTQDLCPPCWKIQNKVGGYIRFLTAEELKTKLDALE